MVARVGMGAVPPPPPTELELVDPPVAALLVTWSCRSRSPELQAAAKSTIPEAAQTKDFMVRGG